VNSKNIAIQGKKRHPRKSKKEKKGKKGKEIKNKEGMRL
jgi:hypothetical protein